MKQRYLVLAFSIVLAVAVAVPALGQSSEPTATSAASAKKLAKKANKKAKKANKKAKQANQAANAAQGSADAAQASADEALGQQGRFSYLTDTDATITNLFEGGGVRIEATCAATDLEVNARSLANNSIIHVGTIDNANTANYDEDDAFDNNQTEQLDADAVDDSVQGTFTFRNGQNDTIVTGTYLLEEDYNGNDCATFGNVEIL